MKFACFERTVEALYRYVIPKPREQCSKTEQLGVTFIAGYIAGIFCAIVSHPADTIVSKLNNEKGLSLLDAVRRVGLAGKIRRSNEGWLHEIRIFQVYGKVWDHVFWWLGHWQRCSGSFTIPWKSFLPCHALLHLNRHYHCNESMVSSGIRNRSYATSVWKHEQSKPLQNIHFLTIFNNVQRTLGPHFLLVLFWS